MRAGSGCAVTRRMRMDHADAINPSTREQRSQWAAKVAYSASWLAILEHDKCPADLVCMSGPLDIANGTYPQRLRHGPQG